MTTKIYIARHGETEWNQQGKMQGWKDSSLTPKGIENAQRLGSYLKDTGFDCVICSPLGRAVQTAKHIMGDRDLLMVYNSAFKEMGFGQWEGMDHDSVKELYPTQQQNYWSAPHLYEAIDGESYEAFIARVKEGLEGLMQNHQKGNLLLVTHAAVIKAIFNIVCQQPLSSFWDPPFIYDTCLSVLEVRDGIFTVLQEPDIPHLK
jgi:broad specificity phosphatase PhoE